MIYTEMTKKALDICFDAHKDQRDKSGLPYVFHPFHLAEQMKDEDSTIVALLHDVVEDSSYTLEDLREQGFREAVLDALRLMTHDPDVPYMAYVAQIKKNPIAKKVKLADLRHNSDISRLDAPTEKDRERVEKYREATALLMAQEEIKPAKLIRVKTDEVILLKKQVFRIGKEKSYNDYCVADNSAVSRSHANIVCRDGAYYIIDTNSTNCTCIDGKPIETNQEVLLAGNCEILLADEKFFFVLDDAE